MKFNLLLDNLLLLSLFCVIALNIFSKDNDEKVIVEERIFFDKEGNIVEIDTATIKAQPTKDTNNDSCSDHSPNNDRAAGQCTYNMDCPNGYSCDSFGMCEPKSKTWK